MPRVKISARELRVKFNDAKITERVASGEVVEKIRHERHPSRPKANEPFCTRSQIVMYYSLNGHYICHAHRYLRTDNTIGASGKPDPKQFAEGDTLYVVVEPSP
jgi:hypothetical protein